MAISMPIFVWDARIAWEGGWGRGREVLKCFFKKTKGGVGRGNEQLSKLWREELGDTSFCLSMNLMLEKKFFPIHCAINHSFRVSTKTVYILWTFVKMTFTRISQDFYLTLFLIYLSFQKLNRNIVWKRSVDWNNRHFIPDKDRVHANIFTGR